MRNGQASINRRIAEIDRWGWDREFMEEIERTMRFRICIYVSECECDARVLAPGITASGI